MPIRQLTLVVLPIALLLAAAPLPAQQTTGTPGSPGATTTVDGRYIPNPPAPFGGVINLDAQNSKPFWPPRVVPPKGAPNVLLIITDDVGFGAPSTFGGLIPTPNMDRIAKAGLRYTNFHSTALCSPTRAALITGRNHHSVGFGVITEISTGYPGYNSVITKDKATVGKILKDNGFATSWFGKNHNTPSFHASQAGPFDQWPIGMGFDYFYGFMGGETSQWQPGNLVRNTTPIHPYVGKQGWNLITAMADDDVHRRGVPAFRAASASFGARILQIVHVAVFGADEQIGYGIAIPIDGRGAGVVSFQVGRGQRALALKHDAPFARRHVAKPLGVLSVDQQIEPAVAIPIDGVQLTAAALAVLLRIEPQRLVLLIDKRAPRRQKTQRLIVAAAPLKQRQIPFLVQHGQVGKLVAREIGHHRRSSPLGDKLPAARLPPGPLGLGRLSGPFNFNGARGPQPRLGRAADVLKPDDFAPDGVHNQVQVAIEVPIGHAQRGVAPVGFAGALDGAVGPGLDANDFPLGRQSLRRGPTRELPLRQPQVLVELEVARRVARHDVVVAIAIPIGGDGCGERPALDPICLLLEVARRQELRQAAGDAPGVLDEGDAAIFVADDQVAVAIGVPIDGRRHNHLQIHAQRLAFMLQDSPCRIARRGARAEVLKVREAVQKLSAHQVQIAIAVEIGKVGGGPAEDFDRSANSSAFRRSRLA